VKHKHFDGNQNKIMRDKKPYSTDKLAYNQDNDQFTCPSGKPMKYIYSSVKRTATGFEQTLDFYQANKCNGCPLRTDCHDQKVNRVIQVNHNLNRLKEQANRRLTSKKGVEKRKKRCFDTEPVFGNIKHNHHFKRFMLRGINKVAIETGLLAIAHNIRKKVA
jgi:hypothetical protein